MVGAVARPRYGAIAKLLGAGIECFNCILRFRFGWAPGLSGGTIPWLLFWPRCKRWVTKRILAFLASKYTRSCRKKLLCPSQMRELIMMKSAYQRISMHHWRKNLLADGGCPTHHMGPSKRGARQLITFRKFPPSRVYANPNCSNISSVTFMLSSRLMYAKLVAACLA